MHFSWLFVNHQVRIVTAHGSKSIFDPTYLVATDLFWRKGPRGQLRRCRVLCFNEKLFWNLVCHHCHQVKDFSKISGGFLSRLHKIVQCRQKNQTRLDGQELIFRWFGHMAEMSLCFIVSSRGFAPLLPHPPHFPHPHPIQTSSGPPNISTSSWLNEAWSETELEFVDCDAIVAFQCLTTEVGTNGPRRSGSAAQPLVFIL